LKINAFYSILYLLIFGLPQAHLAVWACDRIGRLACKGKPIDAKTGGFGAPSAKFLLCAMP
jgi:hypothetical protein